MSENRLNEIDFEAKEATINKGYSRFIRFLRLGLPLLALGLTVVVITWPQKEDKILTIAKEDILPDVSRAENELINPQFQSRDRDLNPYTVTASRALQSQDNPDLVKLENPAGHINLKGGALLKVNALNGSYEQEQERLFLAEDVALNHEDGYTLLTEELRLDLKNREAFSDKDVEITSQDGVIRAVGMEGFLEEEILTFRGPATLTINQKPETQTP